ncbi:MAG: TonB family protein [Phyllobacteriaceae bacterium]|nr:TonB family protein [Phyllobacteriaceae bacterium]
MNAHPHIGLLLAGPLEAVVAPDELDAGAATLTLAPSRSHSAAPPLPALQRGPMPAAFRRPPWRRGALALSVLVHVAAAWAIGDRLARGPLEADDPQAIAVELVLESHAPTPPAATAAGTVDASAGTGVDVSAEAAIEPRPVDVPGFDPELALTPPLVERPSQPVLAPPPAGTLSVLATPPRIAEPRAVAAPAEKAEPKKTVVTAEKSREKAKTRPAVEKPAAKAAPAKTMPKATRVANAPATVAAKAKANDRSDGGKTASRAGNGGRTGGAEAKPAGASAAAKAAYAARLHAHVQRFKRPPATAAAGVTRLMVTIGRDGGLRGARIASSAGNAALDAEARATARRAAPYPRAPDGIGGATITFAVNIRFAH